MNDSIHDLWVGYENIFICSQFVTILQEMEPKSATYGRRKSTSLGTLANNVTRWWISRQLKRSIDVSLTKLKINREPDLPPPLWPPVDRNDSHSHAGPSFSLAADKFHVFLTGLSSLFLRRPLSTPTFEMKPSRRFIISRSLFLFQPNKLH